MKLVAIIRIMKAKSNKKPERIESDPDICGGVACVRGTRIPVSIILSHMAAGDREETILKSFPQLTRKDLHACLEYAAFLATEKSIPA